jgi:hypothetical protein
MSFANEVKAFQVKAEDKTEEQVKFICLTLLTDLVMGTPVDTGRARGNWQASINSPVITATSRRDKVGRGTIKEEGRATEQAPGNIFYITNNLPYISVLEYGMYGNPPGSANGPKTTSGFSNQSKSGWIRYSIERAKQLAAKL